MTSSTDDTPTHSLSPHSQVTYSQYPKPRSDCAPGQRLLVNGCLLELLTQVDAHIGSDFYGGGAKVRVSWAALALDGTLVEVTETLLLAKVGHLFWSHERKEAMQAAAVERAKPEVWAVSVSKAAAHRTVYTYTRRTQTFTVEAPQAVQRAQERLLRQYWPDAVTPFVLVS